MRFNASKSIIERVKRQPSELEKTLGNHVSGEGLVQQQAKDLSRPLPKKRLVKAGMLQKMFSVTNHSGNENQSPRERQTDRRQVLVRVW